MGGDHARHGVQTDNCDRPATHAIATGVPPPSASSPPLGPPPRPHAGSVEGLAELLQGVDRDPSTRRMTPWRAWWGADDRPRRRETWREETRLTVGNGYRRQSSAKAPWQRARQRRSR